MWMHSARSAGCWPRDATLSSSLYRCRIATRIAGGPNCPAPASSVRSRTHPDGCRSSSCLLPLVGRAPSAHPARPSWDPCHAPWRLAPAHPWATARRRLRRCFRPSCARRVSAPSRGRARPGRRRPRPWWSRPPPGDVSCLIVARCVPCVSLHADPPQAAFHRDQRDDRCCACWRQPQWTCRAGRLHDVLDIIGHRSFGPLLLFAGIVMLAPVVGDIPGVPVLMGLGNRAMLAFSPVIVEARGPARDLVTRSARRESTQNA